MAVDILDPGNRLPPGVQISMPESVAGLLIAPDRGVPLHPESVRRFVAQIRQDRPACFVPEIPVATELGLPRYEPLLYWMPYPGGVTKRLLQRLRVQLRRLQHGPAWCPSLPSDCQRLTDLSKDEQVHYFAEHLHTLCPTPRQVSVVVSNTCNLKCVMCPYHSPLIRPTHQTEFFQDRIWMPWEVMDRLASECGEHRIPVKVGNIEEPLLHPRMVDFVRACRSRGVPWIHITTNGVVLTEELGLALLDAGLTSLYISIDAARPETYRRVRGASLERLESNVRSFLRLRKVAGSSCSVLISFVRNKEVTEEEQLEFRERWLQESDGVIFYNLAEYESGNSQFAVVNPVAKDLMERAGGRWPCLNPWQEVYILPDGRVYYCCETVSKLAFENLQSMGSYPQQGLLELWRGPLFTHLRRDLILNQLEQWPACKDCGIWMAHATSASVQDGVRTTTNMITEIVEYQACP